MVVLLTRHRADPMVRDVEGFACIHVAAQCGFTNIVAYLLAVAGGAGVNTPDDSGMTALMWSAYKTNGSVGTEDAARAGRDQQAC